MDEAAIVPAIKTRWLWRLTIFVFGCYVVVKREILMNGFFYTKRVMKFGIAYSFELHTMSYRHLAFCDWNYGYKREADKKKIKFNKAFVGKYDFVVNAIWLLRPELCLYIYSQSPRKWMILPLFKKRKEKKPAFRNTWRYKLLPSTPIPSLNYVLRRPAGKEFRAQCMIISSLIETLRIMACQLKIPQK